MTINPERFQPLLEPPTQPPTHSQSLTVILYICGKIFFVVCLFFFLSFVLFCYNHSVTLLLFLLEAPELVLDGESCLLRLRCLQVNVDLLLLLLRLRCWCLLFVVSCSCLTAVSRVGGCQLTHVGKMRGGSSATEEYEVDLGLSCSPCSVLQPEARERVLQCVLHRLWEKIKN